MQDLRNVDYIVVATNNQHAIVQAFAEANGVSQMLGGASNALTIQHITTSDSVPPSTWALSKALLPTRG